MRWYCEGMPAQAKRVLGTGFLDDVIGAVLSGIHMYASEGLRDSSAYANFIFHINTFILLSSLFLRIPPIWDRLGFDQSVDQAVVERR